MKIIQHNGFGCDTPTREQRLKPFAHKPTTLVIEGVPENDQLIGLISRFIEGEIVEIPLNIGLATCHPKDEFCKKTGLTTAYKNTKLYTAAVDSLSIYKKGEMRVGFKTLDGTVYLKYRDGHRPVLDGDSFTRGD